MLVWWLILICALGGGLLVVGGFNREKQPADELLRRYAEGLTEAREQARRATREHERPAHGAARPTEPRAQARGPAG